jgi:hypothetical protein
MHRRRTRARTWPALKNQEVQPSPMVDALTW